MSTKLTKAFAKFVGEMGFEIANEDEIGQQPEADYKLARQIVYTIHDNIPANIFEPQILMTIGGIQKRLKRLLSADYAAEDWRGVSDTSRQFGAAWCDKEV